MTKPPKTRLNERMANFKKAVNALDLSVRQPVTEARDISGIIKDFEIAYELGWKTLKTFLEDQGHETKSAKDVFAQAYQLKYLNDEGVWLEMINDRNLSVHTYDDELARQLMERIRDAYVPVFDALLKTLISAKP